MTERVGADGAADRQPVGLGYVVALLAMLALMVTLRLIGPSDLYDNDQPKTVSYAVDVAVNGAWLLQHEPDGSLTTKPPMYQWVGGATIGLVGRTDEWVLKLPSLLAAGVTIAVVIVLARPYVGGAGACVAAAAWAANPHVYKLAYTARPDALLAMFLAIALLAAVRQRERWLDPAGPTHGSRAATLAWIATFWLAVAGGLLTKGPAAFIAVAFLLGLVIHDGAWRGAAPAAQGGFALLALGLCAAWLYAALQAHPAWWGVLNEELFYRVAGTGERQRAYKPWNIPIYFVGRWWPWSFAFLIGIALAIAMRGSGRRWGWTIAWVAIVIGAFLFHRGGRGDYVLPAYAGAAVLVAGVFTHATRRADALRVLSHLFLGAVGAVGLACSILVLVAPRPGPIEWVAHGFAVAPVGPAYDRLIWLVAGVAVVSGVATWVAIHLRNYLAGAVAGGFVMVATSAFLGLTWHASAQDRTGDTLGVFVDVAEELRAQRGLPIVIHEPGYTPVSSLLGIHAPIDERALDTIPASGALLITSAQAWEAVRPRVASAELLLHTPMLTESRVELMLVSVRPRQ
jgi:4-amino-4-deoxy-L-arabinose transferase-like glycosyltransferase